MENSEQQTQIINLGKHFVNELGLDSGVDTFSKWMAHYLAEKMTLLEQLPIDDKKETEKECFEIILNLWERRWVLASGKRPFEKFEPILKTLEKLNPENQEPFFYHSFHHELSKLEKENPELKEIMDLTNIALEIDKTARIWIDFILHQAALKAKNERTEALLTNTVSLSNTDDARIISLLFSTDPSIDEENYTEEDTDKKYRLEKLKIRIDELERFKKINEFLLESYKKDLGTVQET